LFYIFVQLTVEKLIITSRRFSFLVLTYCS